MTSTCVNALKHTKAYYKKRRRTCRHDNLTIHKTDLKMSLDFNRLNYEWNSIFLSTLPCISLIPHLPNCDRMIMLEIALNDKQYIKELQRTFIFTVFFVLLIAVLHSRNSLWNRRNNPFNTTSSYLNPIHISLTYFPKVHFKTTVQYTTPSRKLYLSLWRQKAM